jgi:1,4-dihydroxy-2-naphthoate octaprenyltransferase
MSGDLLDGATALAALLLIGATIKLMDDYLDAEYDICRGKRTLAIKLSRASLPYALCLGLIAGFLKTDLAISIFFGSYAVGMLSTWKEKLPTKVPAYVEIAVAIALSVALVGWKTALWGVALMAVFDWIDDIVDLSADQRTGQRNLARRIGVVETTLLTLSAMCVAVLCNTWWTALGFIAFTLLTVLAEATTSNLWRDMEEEKGAHS